jgi:hypothetical protein
MSAELVACSAFQIQDQDFRAAVSRISCHDGQNNRSSPSGLSGRLLID